jgi:hypothetical protein
VDVRILTTGHPSDREYDGIRTLRLPIHRYRMKLAVQEIVISARDVDAIRTSAYHACRASWIAGRKLHKPVALLVTALFQDANGTGEVLQLGSAYHLLKEAYAELLQKTNHG